jgi:hypothetical protein
MRQLKVKLYPLAIAVIGVLAASGGAFRYR